MAVKHSRLWLGKEIRAKWAQASAVECEPLMFGDLQPGDQFIAFPFPGDNEGHGGLLDGCHLFQKTGLMGSTAPVNAVRRSYEFYSYFKDDVFVIKVD